MKRETYIQLVEALRVPAGAVPNFRYLAAQHKVECQTLISIWSVESQHAILKTHHQHMAKFRSYTARYLAGEDVLDLSYDIDFPPCLVVRHLLEHVLPLGKQKLSEVMRDPSLLPSLRAAGRAEDWQAVSPQLLARLQQDVAVCIRADLAHSAFMDAVRRSAGLEHELKLCRLLTELGIPFWSEHDMRLQGYFKTPDIRLQVPVVIQDHIVHWVDSKATFGDDRQHHEYSQKQYSTYINRYGPGMVIYWCGFLEDLTPDPNLLLLDHFPEPAQITTLPQLPCSMGQAVG